MRSRAARIAGPRSSAGAPRCGPNATRRPLAARRRRPGYHVRMAEPEEVKKKRSAYAPSTPRDAPPRPAPAPPPARPVEVVKTPEPVRAEPEPPAEKPSSEPQVDRGAALEERL